MAGQVTTYKLMYWLRDNIHYTAPTYKTKAEAKKGLEAFKKKRSHLKVRIVKQTVVSI